MLGGKRRIPSGNGERESFESRDGSDCATATSLRAGRTCAECASTRLTADLWERGEERRRFIGGGAL